jgi:hypothetical protein
VAGVEVEWVRFGGENADARWEKVVEGAKEICRGDAGGEGERGDLAKSMDTCVGATGALGQDALAGDAVKSIAQSALDGGQAGLDLPAMIGGSVVGEGELPVGHDALDGITLTAWSGRALAGLQGD